MKQRPKAYYYTNMGMRFRHVAPYRSDVDTFLHAVVCRAKLVKLDGVYGPRPRPQGQAYGAFYQKLATMPRTEVHKLSAEAFVASRPGRVRRLYELALESRQHETRGLRDLAKLKGFLKSEKSEHSHNHISLRPIKAGRPRAIQPRGPAFNLCYGRYTVPVEAVVFDDLDRHFMPLGLDDMPLVGVLKGRSPEAQAAEMRRHWDYHGGDGYAAARSLDQSSFDATVNAQDLQLDHSITASYYPGDKFIKRLQSMQFRNQMTAFFPDGKVKTNLGPMRMSGDMNTSLGNCCISFAMAWEIFSPYGITFVANGDDVVLFGPRKVIDTLDVAAVVAKYRSYGKIATPEEAVYVFERCEFCQTRPVLVDGVWRSVRHFDKAINNDYSGFHKLENWDYYLRHIKAVASCGMALSHGVPVLQSLYAWGLQHGASGKFMWDDLRNTGLYRMAKAQGGWRRARPISESTRESFMRAFGVSCDMQLALEAALDSLGAPTPWPDPIVQTGVPDNANDYKSRYIVSALLLNDYQHG